MLKLKNIPLAILGVGGSLFAVTFTMYFFNLDMKLLSCIEPWLLKHYDNIPRKMYL